MAPLPTTDDYYQVLQVEQTASSELITRSYRRLALQLHPDRNAQSNATAAFQLLGEAYSTLKDQDKRRAYNLIYSPLRRPQDDTSPRTTQTPSPQCTVAERERAQLAALVRSKQDRSARWQKSKRAFGSLIFELERAIPRLEQEITALDSISAAEAAEGAQKNGWMAWLLSPIHKKRDESDEDKAHKDRKRQERRIERDMKERRLNSRRMELMKERTRLKKEKDEFGAANLSDDIKIQTIRNRVKVREDQEKERVEKERIAKWWKQELEKRDQELEERNRAAEARCKQEEEGRSKQEAEARGEQEVEARSEQEVETRRRQEAEAWAAAQRQSEEAVKRQERHYRRAQQLGASTYSNCTPICLHIGWWPKVHGRTVCPRCDESWTYLLQCPGCSIMACPRCQSKMKLRDVKSGKYVPRMRTPSPDYDNYY